MGLDRTRLPGERWETEDAVDKVPSEFPNVKLLVKLSEKHCIAVRATVDEGKGIWDEKSSLSSGNKKRKEEED
nr:hypothetical protein [Tanacetum cinerariifolium]